MDVGLSAGLDNLFLGGLRVSVQQILSNGSIKQVTIFYKGIMPSEKILDFPVDCNFLTGSVNL